MATQTPVNTLNAVIKTSQSANTLNFESAKLLLEGSIVFQEFQDQGEGAWAVAKVQKSQVTLTGRLTQTGKAAPNSRQRAGVTVRTIKYQDLAKLGQGGTPTKVLPAAMGTDKCMGWHTPGGRFRLEGPTADKEGTNGVGKMRLMKWDSDAKEWECYEEEFDVFSLLGDQELNAAVVLFGEPRLEMVDPLTVQIFYFVYSDLLR